MVAMCVSSFPHKKRFARVDLLKMISAGVAAVENIRNVMALLRNELKTIA
jgi:hypothetical protein